MHSVFLMFKEKPWLLINLLFETFLQNTLLGLIITMCKINLKMRFLIINKIITNQIFKQSWFIFRFNF